MKQYMITYNTPVGGGQGGGEEAGGGVNAYIAVHVYRDVRKI